MSEKKFRKLRAMWGYPAKEPVPSPIRSSRIRHTSAVRFKNKKHTLGRRKRATHLNNWNNLPCICARGTATPEEYALYLKYKRS